MSDPRLRYRKTASFSRISADVYTSKCVLTNITLSPPLCECHGSRLSLIKSNCLETSCRNLSISRAAPSNLTGSPNGLQICASAKLALFESRHPAEALL